MSTADEIASLNVEIQGYRAMLRDPATNEARKDLLLSNIAEARKTLNALLATITVPTTGNYFSSCYCCGQ
jgi:hypothetical protein